MLWILWLLPALCLAWTAQELEIFKLQDAVVADLGDGASFYSWLEIPSNADKNQITRAFRKLSRAIHPDKNSGNDVEERFSRLGRVHKILRSAARDTYDFYLKKGFPQLRDGDYLFKRYRPSIIAAVVVSLAIASVLQLLMLKADAIRQRQHMQDLIAEATDKAAGPLGAASLKSKKTAKLESGKMAAVYPDGRVYVVQNNVELYVDPSAIVEPTMSDTFLLNMPCAIKKAVARFSAQPVAAAEPSKKDE